MLHKSVSTICQLSKSHFRRQKIQQISPCLSLKLFGGSLSCGILRHCSYFLSNLPEKKTPPFIKQTCGQELRRLLEEVGTDPAETKYWFKQYQRTADNCNDPFAVVQVARDIFQSSDELKSLGSALSFLQKINLKCVVLHGLSTTELNHLTYGTAASQITSDTMELVDMLESLGSPARPFFMGAGIILTSKLPLHCSTSCVDKMAADHVHWALSSGHIPIIPCVGQTPDGQLMNVDISDALEVVLPQLTPRKVFLVSSEGGLLDDVGEAVSTINVPKDLEWAYMMPWCTSDVKQKIRYISALLSNLSPQSSVVLTNPSSILTEIFTHYGAGTLFKNTEAIKTYKSLEDIDTMRLLEVINSSYGRELDQSYLNQVAKKLNMLYLSEDYNAVAIVTNENDMNVAYLDKFSVTKAGQADGLCQLLWDNIRRDYPRLFWRSRHANKVSSWYFKKCEGSWTNGEWIVFWYGVPSHKQSSVLTDYALTLDDYFATTVKDFRPVL